MSTALATKQDLQLLRQEVTAFRTELKQEIESRYTLQDQKIDSVRSDLTREIGTLRGDVARDMAALELRLTIKLGSMFFVAFGLMIAALRIWE